VSRSSFPKEAMLRFVLDQDGTLHPDLQGKAAGRGLWVLADKTRLAEAVRKNLFSKAARRSVRVPDGLVERVETGLARRVEDLIGFARRAGAAQHGIDRVRLWLSEGRAAVYLVARDAGETGRGAMTEAAQGISIVKALDAEAMGRPFGQSRVAHAAIGPGGLAESILVEAARLAGLRGEVAGEYRAEEGEARPRAEEGGTTTRAEPGQGRTAAPPRSVMARRPQATVPDAAAAMVVAADRGGDVAPVGSQGGGARPAGQPNRTPKGVSRGGPKEGKTARLAARRDGAAVPVGQDDMRRGRAKQSRGRTDGKGSDRNE